MFTKGNTYGFKKGQVQNPNGRPKGSHNHFTKKARDDFLWLIKTLGGKSRAYKWAKESESNEALVWKMYFEQMGKPKEEIDVSGDIKFQWIGEDGKNNNGPL